MVTGGKFIFHLLAVQPHNSWPTKSCLIGNLHYLQHGGSVAKVLYVEFLSNNCEKLVFVVKRIL
jgi:hypothetical protein